MHKCTELVGIELSVFELCGSEGRLELISNPFSKVGLGPVGSSCVDWNVRWA